MRIIEEIRPEVKPVTAISAGSIARGGNGHALVRDRRTPSRRGKLGNNPTIGQLVIENDGIAKAARLAGPAEAAPERRDAIRTEKGVTGGFVEDLEAFVDHLNVLRQANGAVCVRRSAAAADAREGNAVEAKDRHGNVRRKEAKQRALIDNGVGAVDMRVRYLWVFGGLTLLAVIGDIPGGHFAQGT